MSSSQKAAVLDPEHIGLHCEINFENTLKQRVKELLKPKNDLFPGSEPINFNSSHLELLCNEDYYVCEKSDGVRYLLLSTHTKEGPSCFLINKRNSYQYISSLMLPCRENLTTFQHESLLDGELVIDEDKVTGKKSAHFLAFDLMVYNTNLITHRSFATRLGMLQQEIIAPLDKFLNSNPEISKKQPFSIKLKKMERSYGLSVVLSNIPNLKHPSDGLIFTPVGLPYKSGNCSKLLKWKPLEKLTVDFRIQVTYNMDRKPVYNLQVLHNGSLKVISPLQLSPDQYAKWRLSPPEGKIAEFRWDPNWRVMVIEKGYAPQTVVGGWVFIKFRLDKNMPNNEQTIREILKIIENGVSREKLEQSIEKIRSQWKERERLSIGQGSYYGRNDNLDLKRNTPAKSLTVRINDIKSEDKDHSANSQEDAKTPTSGAKILDSLKESPSPTIRNEKDINEKSNLFKTSIGSKVDRVEKPSEEENENLSDYSNLKQSPNTDKNFMLIENSNKKANSLNGTQVELLDSKNPSINSKEASKRAYSVPNINTKNSFMPQKRRMLSGSDFSTLNNISLKSIEEVYENNKGLISGDSSRIKGLSLVKREGFLSHIPESQSQEDDKSDSVNKLEAIGQEPKSMDSSLVDDADFNRIENFEIEYDQAPEAKNKNSVSERDSVNTMKHEGQTHIDINNSISKDTIKNSNTRPSADNCENNIKLGDNEIKDVIANNNIEDIDVKNKLLIKTDSNNKNDLEENHILEATTKNLYNQDQDPKKSRDCNNLEGTINDVQNQNKDLTKPSNLNTLVAVPKSVHNQAKNIKESTNLYAVEATENGDLKNSSNIHALTATTKGVNNQNQDLTNPSTVQIEHHGNTNIINKSQGYSSTNKSAKASNIFMLMSSNDFSPLPKVAEVSNIPNSIASKFVQEKQANVNENKTMVEDVERSDRTSLNNHSNNMISNGILGSENSFKDVSNLGDGNDRPSKKGRSNKNYKSSFGIFKNEKTPNMLQTQNKDLLYEDKEPLKHIKNKFNSTSDTKVNILPKIPDNPNVTQDSKVQSSFPSHHGIQDARTYYRPLALIPPRALEPQTNSQSSLNLHDIPTEQPHFRQPSFTELNVRPSQNLHDISTEQPRFRQSSFAELSARSSQNLSSIPTEQSHFRQPSFPELNAQTPQNLSNISNEQPRLRQPSITKQNVRSGYVYPNFPRGVQVIPNVSQAGQQVVYSDALHRRGSVGVRMVSIQRPIPIPRVQEVLSSHQAAVQNNHLAHLGFVRRASHSQHIFRPLNMDNMIHYMPSSLAHSTMANVRPTPPTFNIRNHVPSPNPNLSEPSFHVQPQVPFYSPQLPDYNQNQGQVYVNNQSYFQRTFQSEDIYQAQEQIQTQPIIEQEPPKSTPDHKSKPAPRQSKGMLDFIMN